MNEKVQRTLPLKAIYKDFYTTAAFVAPSQMFKVAVLGKSVRNGQPIKRIAKIPITPQEPPIVLPDPKKPIVIISEGSKTEVDYGKTLKLTCKVSTYPKPKIVWKNKNGNTLPSQSSAVEPPYEYISYLTIPDITEGDTYTCNVISPKYGVTDKTVDVVVKDPFVIKSTVRGTTELQYAKKGTLKCDIKAAVPIHIYWKYEDGKGKTTLLKTSDKYSISANGTQLDINKMDLNMAGKYTCIAYLVKDPKRMVSFDTNVKVGGLARPVVSGSPEIKISQGSNIDIRCHITGVPKPSITWQFRTKDSLKYIPISGSDHVLHLTNVNVKQAGRYKCIASNAVGQGDHETILTVQVPPTITSNAYVFNVIEDKDKVLRIPFVVAGDPKPVVSWLKGVEPIAKNNKYVIEDQALVINNPKVADSSEYKCKAKNDAGSITKTFQVHVSQFPKVSGEIAKKTKVGDSVQIPCTILKGAPRPKLSWEFKGKNDVKFIPIEGSNNMLVISRVDRKNDGLYKCIAQNNVGRDEHITALNVEFAPIIAKNLKTYQGLEGDVAMKIPCEAIGNPSPVITWKLGNTVINADVHHSIVDGALVIKSPKVEDSKTYSCEAKNYLGSVTASFKAEITKNLEDYGNVSVVHILDGTSKKLDCVPAGPNQSVRWFLQGEELNVTTKYLDIKQIDITKEGNYSCRVSDMNGGHTYTYELIVGYAPTFSYEQEDTLFDWEGDDDDEYDMLDCTVNAKPVPEITWTYNGQVIDEKSYRLSVSSKWGHYTCKVSNVHGTIGKTFNVISSKCLIPRRPKTASINKMPLILTPESTWLVLDSTKDFLKVGPGETIIFYCPNQNGAMNNILKSKSNEVKAVCEKQDMFKVDGVVRKVSDFECSQEIQSAVVKREGKCLTDKSELIRVGYDVHGFLETYEVCFDTSKNIPMYSRVVMSKSTLGQGTVYSWHKHPGIGGRSDESLYTCSSSKPTCCYDKSQLVNARDVIDGPAQRSTYIDSLNAVPYWRPCGSYEDPWSYIESNVTARLRTFDQFTAWTGTYKLQEKNGHIIPRYLWKVINFNDEESIAIVYVNDKSFTNDDILCTNTCADNDSIPWLGGRKVNTYCCEVPEFLKAFGLSGSTVGQDS